MTGAVAMGKEQGAVRKTTEGQRWLERARRVTSGPQSNLRAASGESPLILERGEGLRLYDVDGNDYVDFNLGMGPGLWGHGHRRYVEAVQRQIETLLFMPSGIAQTTLEIEVAEKICAHVPSAERVRFGSTGSEAVQLVIRVARAFTGRPYFVRFESNYHGWIDNVYGGVVNPDRGAVPFAVDSDADAFATLGRFPGAQHESFKLPWNDIGILEATLRKHGKDIALVLMEPILCNGGCLPPRPGYLERVRSLCDEFDVVLCFDEIITGFRVGLGGAQKQLGVTPDITTFGKALTAGLPLSAIAGKRVLMDLLREGKVTAAGTFNACPPSMAASLVSIRMLEEDAGAYYKAVDRQQARLKAALLASAERHGHKLMVQGPRGLLYTEFVDRSEAYTAADLQGADVDKSRRLRLLLIEEGVVIGRGNRWFVSGVLAERDMDDAVVRIDRALARL
jgi:glutamate-1-semialdehyde 2,1-aminomutase